MLFRTSTRTLARLIWEPKVNKDISTWTEASWLTQKPFHIQVWRAPAPNVGRSIDHVRLLAVFEESRSGHSKLNAIGEHHCSPDSEDANRYQAVISEMPKMADIYVRPGISRLYSAYDTQNYVLRVDLMNERIDSVARVVTEVLVPTRLSGDIQGFSTPTM